MSNAKISKKTTLWLGSDDDELEDGYPAGMQGYGFDVNSEDNMVAIRGTTEGGEYFEVFIMRDLWPKIRAVMSRIDKRFDPPAPTVKPEVSTMDPAEAAVLAEAWDEMVRQRFRKKDHGR